jgi:hypothetical protein
MTQTTSDRNRQARHIPPEETEGLRATVPDDPIKLPAGHLPCGGCGVAVPAVKATSSVTPPSGRLPALPVQFARRPAAHGVWFSNPLSLTRDRCSPWPWAHVTLSQRADLRKAYADAMRDRLTLAQPPVALRCPTGACVFCGVGSVNRAAIEVARRGGVKAMSHAVWREVNTDPKALGSRGPERILAHTCPACSAAIEEAGAIGWVARAVAVVNYLALSEPKKAERLRSMLSDDRPPVLPAWRVMPKARPSVEPWEHLRRPVFERL